MSKKFDLRKFFDSLEVGDLIDLAGVKFVSILEKDDCGQLTIGCGNQLSAMVCDTSPINFVEGCGIVSANGKPLECFNEGIPLIEKYGKLKLIKGGAQEQLEWHKKNLQWLAGNLVTSEEFEQIIANEDDDLIRDIKLILSSKDFPTSIDDIQVLLSLIGVGNSELTARQIVLLVIVRERYVLLSGRRFELDLSEENIARLQELKKLHSKDFIMTEEDADEFFAKEENKVKVNRLQEVIYKDDRFNTKTSTMQAIVDIIGLNEGELTKEKIILFLSILKNRSFPRSMAETISLGLLLGLTDFLNN